jgi:phage RecT family recombinase
VNEIVKQDPLSKFDSQMSRLDDRLRAVLPPHVTPEKFKQVARLAVQTKPELLEADRTSLFMSCVKAAEAGIMPDGRQGAFVVIKDKGVPKVNFMAMVEGIIGAAFRSGRIASLRAHIVYKDEVFEVELGDEEKIIHRRNPEAVARGFGNFTSKGPDNVVAAYCIWDLANPLTGQPTGIKVRQVMYLPEIERVRRAGKAPDGVFWKNWFDQMALKSVIHRSKKLLPRSAEDVHLERLHKAIENHEQNFDFDSERLRKRMEEQKLANEIAEEVGLPKTEAEVSVRLGWIDEDGERQSVPTPGDWLDSWKGHISGRLENENWNGLRDDYRRNLPTIREAEELFPEVGQQVRRMLLVAIGEEKAEPGEEWLVAEPKPKPKLVLRDLDGDGVDEFTDPRDFAFNYVSLAEDLDAQQVRKLAERNREALDAAGEVPEAAAILDKIHGKPPGDSGKRLEDSMPGGGKPGELTELAQEAVARVVLNRARSCEGMDEGLALLEAWHEKREDLQKLRGTEAWAALLEQLGAAFKRSLGVEVAAAFVAALKMEETAHVAAFQVKWEAAKADTKRVKGGGWRDALNQMQEKASRHYDLLRGHAKEQIMRVRAKHATPPNGGGGGSPPPPAPGSKALDALRKGEAPPADPEPAAGEGIPYLDKDGRPQAARTPADWVMRVAETIAALAGEEAPAVALTNYRTDMAEILGSLRQSKTVALKKLSQTGGNMIDEKIRSVRDAAREESERVADEALRKADEKLKGGAGREARA